VLPKDWEKDYMDLREAEMTLFSQYGNLQQRLKEMVDTVVNVSEHIAKTSCKPQSYCLVHHS
jgi:hypothetical protein